MTDKRSDTPEESAVTAEFVRCESFLKRFLRRFLSHPQDIEDVVQDTFLKAYNAEQKRTIHMPKAFLFQVARNTALKALNKKSREITESIEELEVPEVYYDEVSVVEQVEIQQKLGLFCESALHMSPKVRRTFLLRKVYGLSHREIADQLGIAVSTVEKHVAKGLEVCSAYVSEAEASNPVAQKGRKGA